jgi:hypothetical protein
MKSSPRPEREARITEWPVEFLSPYAQANRLDIIRGLT